MGIRMEELPREMSLSKLADRCMSEIDNYRRGESHDDQYCLEIFRRAMLQHDERAWEVLQQRFNGIMLGWLRRHPGRETANYIDSNEQNFVDQAFARFWMATARNQEVEFSTLGAALKFLHATLNATIIDALRAHSRSKEVPLPDPGHSEEPAAEDSYDDGGELWVVIKSMLSDEREQRVAYLLFHCNLKPRQILHFCPQEFKDEQEIYRLRRNILERLQRNRDRFRWLLGDEEL